MLIELYGQNFGCFRDEFRLSMLATDLDPGSDRGIVEVKVEGDDEPLRLLRAVAIYGPNASGKSTVLRAANGLRELVGRPLPSDAPIRSYEPFALDPKEKPPTRIGVKAVINRRVYDYEVQFSRVEVTSELLRLLGPEGQEKTLLHRRGEHVEGAWTDDPQFMLLAKDFRRNALLLSLADRFAPAVAGNIAVGVRQLLTPLGNFADSYERVWLSQHVAKRAHEDPAFGAWLLGQLQSADLGVADLRVEARKIPVESVADEPEAQTIYHLSLTHRGADGFFSIPYGRESHGTQKLVQIAPALFDLAHGTGPRAVFVDEIDESLHPALLQGIIRHFNCEVPVEQARGQLIFVTHDTTLLDAEAKNAVLRRDQVYLTEKDASGAARLYSVAEFKERNNMNIAKRYLEGRYGALPSLGTFAE